MVFDSEKHEPAVPDNSIHKKELPFVSSLSPAYPKYRDALIIGSVILILILILVGGYFLTRGAKRPLREFIQKPVESLSALYAWSEAQKLCESYVHKNEKRFSHLGRHLKFSLIKQDIRLTDREKTARITMRVKGSLGINYVHFLLDKQTGSWRIISAILERKNGEYEKLYPST